MYGILKGQTRAMKTTLCLSVVVLLVACEPVGDANLEVTVPVELQSALADKYPIQIVVAEEYQTCTRPIGIVCDTAESALKFDWVNGALCPGPTDIKVFAVPVVETEDEPIKCGAQDFYSPCIEEDNLAAPLTEIETVSIFERGNCDEGTENHSVTLRLKAGD